MYDNYKNELFGEKFLENIKNDFIKQLEQV